HPILLILFGEMVANEASCLTVSVWICCKVTKSDLQWFNPGQFSVQYSASWPGIFSLSGCKPRQAWPEIIL
ncbi:hypothetical protein NL539_28915, partial [Aeromonas sp. CPF2-S1]|nr:hypothetical protein [Aeromonas sp. CPF2-S1]